MITIFPDDETKALWMEIKKIAQRENRTASDVARDSFRDYIKKHGEGNPNFVLEKWVNDPKFRSFPTLGEDPYKWDVRGLSEKELREINSRLYVWDNAVKQALLNVKRT